VRAPAAHHGAEPVDDTAGLDGLALTLRLLVELRERGARDLVAAELGEELLLRGQVEVLVALHLLPDALHVERDAVGRDPLVVRGLEHEARVRLVDEALAQVRDAALERVRGEDLVRQAREREVEEVFQLAVLEARRLGQPVPDLHEVRLERRGEVLQRRRADVVADHEQ
jgi:hypothetical protein